jgi:hypothetical protein
MRAPFYLVPLFLGAVCVAGCSSEGDLPGQSLENPDKAETNADIDIRDVVAENAAAERALNLRARLYVDTHSVVEWYEPFPGRWMISAAGPGKMRPVLTHQDIRSMTPAEMHRKLAPERKVPQVLSDIELSPRFVRPPVQVPDPATPSSPSWGGGSAPPSPGSRPMDGASTGQGSSDQFCSPEWFNFWFCSATGWDYKQCNLNWWDGVWSRCGSLPDGGWAEHSYTALCPVSWRRLRLHIEISECEPSLCDFGIFTTFEVHARTYRYYEFVAYDLPFPAGEDAFNMYTVVWDAAGMNFQFVNYCEED